MKRFAATLLCLGMLSCISGCAMCFTPYDDHYNAFGGIVERQDPLHGRAGSILSDPAMQYTDSSTLIEEATEADLYRLETDQPYLEAIEPQESMDDLDI